MEPPSIRRSGSLIASFQLENPEITLIIGPPGIVTTLHVHEKLLTTYCPTLETLARNPLGRVDHIEGTSTLIYCWPSTMEGFLQILYGQAPTLKQPNAYPGRALDDDEERIWGDMNPYEPPTTFVDQLVDILSVADYVGFPTDDVDFYVHREPSNILDDSRNRHLLTAEHVHAIFTCRILKVERVRDLVARVAGRQHASTLYAAQWFEEKPFIFQNTFGEEQHFALLVQQYSNEILGGMRGTGRSANGSDPITGLSFRLLQG